MIDKREWIQNKAEEVALKLTGHEFYALGPHMQLMCWMKAEEEYKDYCASQIDSVYDRWKEQELMG